MSKNLQTLHAALQDRLSGIKHLVKEVEGNTEEFGLGQLQRIRFILVNGYSISLIKGFGAHAGTKDATFEMAVLDPQGELDYTLTDGDVLGHQTLDDFISLVHKVAAQT
jgi:hypothetical protein